jgi:hypothetical protein
LPFVLNCGPKDAEKIFYAVNKKIFDGITESNRTKFESGFFSKKQYEDKNKEATELYQRRILITGLDS